MSFHVSVQNNKAWCDRAETITSGAVGQLVALDFSDEWDNLSAFAIFQAHTTSTVIPVTGSSVEIPRSVLTMPGVNLLLGVYGVSGDGKVVIPTVYADLGIVRVGANLSGADNYAPPTEALSAIILGYAQAAAASAQEATSGAYASAANFAVAGSTPTVITSDPTTGHLTMSITSGGVTTVTDLGPVSAYAVALAAGYTGTYDQFKALLIANYSTSQDVAAALAAVEAVEETAEQAASDASAAVTTANAASSAASAASTAASAAQAAVASKQAQHKTGTATLAANQSSWSNISVAMTDGSASAVTASNTVIVTPAPASFVAWVEAGVRCSGQGAGTLDFTAETTTTAALTANVVILD